MLKKISNSPVTLLLSSFMSTVMLIVMTIILSEGIAVLKSSVAQTYENKIEIKAIKIRVEHHDVEIEKLSIKTSELEKIRGGAIN